MANREFLGRAVLELTTDPTKLQQGLAAARSQALSSIGGIQKALTTAGARMSETGSRMVVGITAPVIALAGAVTKVGTDFEQTMSQIVGLTDVTRDEIGGIRDEILAMGPELGKTPQELGEAFYFVASAGFNAKEAMEVLRTAATASAAGLGRTGDVAKVLGLTINAYGKENITAARAADILVAAVKDGTAEADAFAGVLGRVVPTAATLGVTFDQVAGSLAAMTLTGLSADEAATSLNQVLVSLLNPAAEAEQALEGMGTSSAELRKELRERGLLATLRDLEERFAGNDEAAGAVFGNVRALRGVLALLTLDSEQLNDVMADTAAAQGDLAEGYKDTEGPARDFARAQAEVHALLISLAQDVLPVVLTGVRGFIEHVRDAVTWFKNLPGPVRETIIQVALLAAAVGPLLIVFGSLVSTLGAMVGAFKLVALTWIPNLIAVFARLAAGTVFLATNGALVLGLKAALLGVKALGLGAVAAAPQIALLGAAFGAVLIAYTAMKDGIDAQALKIGEDVAGTIAGGVIADMEKAKAAIQSGLAELELDKLRPFHQFEGLLSGDAEAALKRDLAALTATLDAAYAEQAAAFRESYDVVEKNRGAMADAYAEAAADVDQYRVDVSADLAETLAIQRQFVSDMLLSIQGFRKELEGAFGAAKSAELDMSDTLLSIAKSQAELQTLEKETAAAVKTGTSVQSLEYRNRKDHILAELSELKLHAALIGDEMHQATALTSLLTSQDMEEGLTSKMPEVKASYAALQAEVIQHLQTLATKGGPAGKAAADAIAKYLDPSNPLSPVHDAKAWGRALVQAYIAGMASMTAAVRHAAFGVVSGALGAFKASSPPGPESPLHFIDVWGGNTVDAWIDGITGALSSKLGRITRPLGRYADPFRALTLPALASSAGSLDWRGVAASPDISPAETRRGGDTFQTTLIIPGAPAPDPFAAIDYASRFQRFGLINVDPRRPTSDRSTTEVMKP